MQEYNDYVVLTKQYLKNYNHFKAATELMGNEIKAIEQEMALDVNPPISKYGDEPAGGYRELNTIEAAADRHIRMQSKIAALREDMQSTRRVLDKVDGALQGLDWRVRLMVLDHYLNSMTWEEVGDKYHYSGKRAGEIGRNAIRDVALMLFGIKAQQVQLSFIFAV